jgi:YggT family protein
MCRGAVKHSCQLPTLARDESSGINRKEVKMTDHRISEVQTTQRDPEREQRFFTFKATQVVWLLFGILEALIALRIGLKLIGANPASPIAVFIYGVTSPFLFPFAGLVGTPSAGGMVLEVSSVIAMVVYGLIAWALERIIWVIFYRPRGHAVNVTKTTTTDQHTHE